MPFRKFYIKNSLKTTFRVFRTQQPFEFVCADRETQNGYCEVEKQALNVGLKDL